MIVQVKYSAKNELSCWGARKGLVQWSSIWVFPGLLRNVCQSQLRIWQMWGFIGSAENCVSISSPNLEIFLRWVALKSHRDLFCISVMSAGCRQNVMGL